MSLPIHFEYSSQDVVSGKVFLNSPIVSSQSSLEGSKMFSVSTLCVQAWKSKTFQQKSNKNILMAESKIFLHQTWESTLSIPNSTHQVPLWRKILNMSLNREIDLGRPLHPAVVPFDHKVAEASKQ